MRISINVCRCVSVLVCSINVELEVQYICVWCMQCVCVSVCVYFFVQRHCVSVCFHVNEERRKLDKANCMIPISTTNKQIMHTYTKKTNTTHTHTHTHTHKQIKTPTHLHTHHTSTPHTKHTHHTQKIHNTHTTHTTPQAFFHHTHTPHHT